MKHQAGLALVLVIWILSLLTIMAGSFALTMRRETTVISAVKDSAETLAAAESGVIVARQMLMSSDPEKQWKADGTLYQVFFEDAEIRVRVMSERGKIDINKADEGLLTKLIQSLSLEMDQQQALVSAIMDWRDSDDLIHINGAEKDEYADAGLSYQPFNREFQFIEELQLVLGMNSEFYRKLLPLITVHSGAAQVDMQLASEEVRAVLSGSEFGSGEGDLPIADQFSEEALLEQPASNNAKTLAGGAFSVISEARLRGDNAAGIKVIIKNNANQASLFQILDWRRTDQTTSLFSDDMDQLLETQQNESGQQY